MGEPKVADEKIHRLLKEFERRSVENALRNFHVYDTRPTVEALVKRARQLGPAGIEDLRRVLAPESDVSSYCALGAARALTELEDGGTLGLVIYQAARIWDRCVEKGAEIGGGGFNSFLVEARKLIPHALRSGPLPEGVIETLSIFVDGVSDWRATGAVFETAAVSGDPRLRDALIQVASHSLSDIRRADAVYALRHYPGLQATVLEAVNDPKDRIASAAAKALVEMLNLVPGCGEEDFERWETWAMRQVPPELQPEKPRGLGRLLRRQPVYDHHQKLFWAACRSAHQGAVQERSRSDMRRAAREEVEAARRW